MPARRPWASQKRSKFLPPKWTRSKFEALALPQNWMKLVGGAGAGAAWGGPWGGGVQARGGVDGD